MQSKKTKDEQLNISIQSLDTLVEKYKKAMEHFGYLELKVKEACLLYLDKHPDCKHGAEKLEMVACAENKEVRDIYLQLVKKRASRKIYEQAIDAFKTNISGLQSLIKFENPV